MTDREFARRRRACRELAAAEGLDGLLLTHLPDIRHLCGFTGSSATVLLLRERGFLMTDFRYREQSSLEVKGLRTMVYERGLEEVLRPALGGRGGLKLGFDAACLSYAEAVAVRRWLKGAARLVPVKGSIGRLRARKSHAEVRIIREGVRRAQAAFQDALRGYDGGCTEKTFADALDAAGRRRGAEERSFATIVASGVRGAVVHAAPQARRMRGATVVDWGVTFRGYCTDMTRTIAFGRVPSVLRDAHSLVLEAQAEALRAIRPGAKAGDVDRAARRVIEEAGLGDRFGHGLGHGVGLEVHEAPHLGRGTRDRLEEGMVVTVEPGIYIPGRGGVRVEDMVLVTRDGAEALTTLPRGLDPAEYL